MKSCGLEYGISELFNSIVLEQQIVKASKSHIQPKTFNDPNDQRSYGHMLSDVMVKTFDSKDEQQIFRKSLEGMSSNYPEILKGQERNMFYCPSAFNFDTRLTDETCSPDGLEEIQASLESKKQLDSKEEKDLRKI